MSKRKTITDHVSFQYSAFFRSLIPKNWAYVMDERARAVQFCVVQLRSFNDYRDRKMTRSTRAQRIQHVVRHVVIKGRGNHSKIGRRTKIWLADNHDSKIKNCLTQFWNRLLLVPIGNLPKDVHRATVRNSATLKHLLSDL